MQSVDRYTKVVLTLLVIGVWGLLLRPFVLEAPAWAQKSTAEKPAAKRSIRV